MVRFDRDPPPRSAAEIERDAMLAEASQALAAVGEELAELVREAFVMASLPRLYPRQELIDHLLKASLLALELDGSRPEETERHGLVAAIVAYVATPDELGELLLTERAAA